MGDYDDPYRWAAAISQQEQIPIAAKQKQKITQMSVGWKASLWLQRPPLSVMQIIKLKGSSLPTSLSYYLFKFNHFQLKSWNFLNMKYIWH